MSAIFPSQHPILTAPAPFWPCPVLPCPVLGHVHVHLMRFICVALNAAGDQEVYRLSLAIYTIQYTTKRFQFDLIKAAIKRILGQQLKKRTYN